MATESVFNARDYKRFGVKYYEENGFVVEVWDVTNLMAPHRYALYKVNDFVFSGRRVFETWEDLRRATLALGVEDIVFSYVSVNGTKRKFLRYLQEAKVKTLGFAFNLLHFDRQMVQPYLKQLGFINRLKRLSFHRLSEKFFSMIPNHYQGMVELDYVFTNADTTAFHRLSGPSTKLVPGHQWDYDLYLSLRDKPAERKKTAVFIDQNLPFHPDRIEKGKKRITTPERYYVFLNKFFETVEKQLDLKVVIAAHPRSFEKDLAMGYGGRQCVFGKTVELIRDSDLVIGHFSTATNFVILFNKPMIFLAVEDFKLDFIAMAMTDLIAQRFGKSPIFVDEPYTVDWEKEISIDRQKYSEYKETYIKRTGTPEKPSWEIIAETLRRDYGR